MTTLLQPPDPTTLCGRDAECGRIETLLEDARSSRSAVLVLRGEAGIGKSALIAEARARAAGMQVLGCRGIESEAQLPFAGLHQLLRPALHHADAIPGVQARALRGALGLEPDPHPERFLVSLAVLSLLAEAAEQAPLLCVVDDAHWLDEASAATLGFVARRLWAEPIAMVFAVRDDAGFDADGLPQLRVRGLDADAAASLLDRTRTLSAEAREWLLHAARGNPLALLELSAALTDAQRAGAEPIHGPLPVSRRVERSFLERVRRLPAATQTLLLVAAADDAGDLTVVLDAAARLGVPAAALDAAEEAGLVRVRGTALELRHPLVRSAIYHGAPLSQRLAAHDALASVLAGDAVADRRAWHRAAASVEPDPAVVEELERAGNRAHARGGYDAASLAFERAAALTLDEARRARLLAAAAENAWLPGQAVRARALVARARAAAADPLLRADLEALEGQIELTCGVPGDAAQTLLRAAQDVAPVDPERALSLLSLASWGAAFARDGETVVAITRCAEALAVPESAASRFLMTRLRGLRAHFTGDFAAAAAPLSETLELAGRADRFALASPVGLFLCDDREILALHRRVAAHARERGALTLLAQAIPWVALGDLWAGRWPAAEAHLAEGLELARATGQTQVLAHLLALQGMLAALRGEEDRCRARTADALEQAAARRLVHVTCCATWALAVLELGLGRPEAALAHARALPVTAGIEWDALDRIEAAVRAGELDIARAGWTRSSRGPAPAGRCGAAPSRCTGARCWPRTPSRTSRPRWPCTSRRAARSSERAPSWRSASTCGGHGAAPRRAAGCARRSTASRLWARRSGPSARAWSCAPAASAAAAATPARSTSSRPRSGRSPAWSPRAAPTGTSPRGSS